MSIRKRLSLAWDIVTGRLGYSVFRSQPDGGSRLVHSTMDESQIYATGKAAIKIMLKSAAATHILITNSTAQAAEEIMKLAPLMKGPINRDPRDIN